VGRSAGSFDPGGGAMSVALRWAGGRTFAVSYRGIQFYLEPCPEAGLLPGADMLTITGAESLDADHLIPVLAASPQAKVVMPKSLADAAHAAGIGYHRMTTTDAALRVEYFKNGEYGRVYGVPAARRGDLDSRQGWTPLGGYPRIGFMARFGAMTIWHSGTGAPYPELADRLRPYSPNVAIVTVGPAGFTEAEAADLAAALDVPWLVAAPEDSAARQRFVDHMLGHHPAQRFKVFELGESWVLPDGG
jgi:hypothetical protein